MTEKKKRGPNKCPKCKKEPAMSIHTCPYDADVNDNPNSKCKCCSTCTQNCADDI